MVLFTVLPYSLLGLVVVTSPWAAVALPGVIFSYPVVLAAVQRSVTFILTGRMQQMDRRSPMSEWIRARASARAGAPAPMQLPDPPGRRRAS